MPLLLASLVKCLSWPIWNVLPGTGASPLLPMQPLAGLLLLGLTLAAFTPAMLLSDCSFLLLLLLLMLVLVLLFASLCKLKEDLTGFGC